MKTNILIVILAGLCCLQGSAKGLKADIRVRVADGTTGKPLVGAKVGCVFKNPPTDWSERRSDERYFEKSDGNGLCRFKGRTANATVYCVLREEGHYRTMCPIPFARVEAGERLIPEYAITTVRVERIEHPIPLFVKKVECSGPDGFRAGEDSVSFDMLKGDWLPPKGTGEVADVVVRRLPRRSLGHVELADERSGEAYEDVLRVEFPGDGNGILEVPRLHSDDLWLRRAPTDGYGPVYEERWGRDRKLNRIDTESLFRCQCFRIRARKDAADHEGERVRRRVGGASSGRGPSARVRASRASGLDFI